MWVYVRVDNISMEDITSFRTVVEEIIVIRCVLFKIYCEYARMLQFDAIRRALQSYIFSKVKLTKAYSIAESLCS